MTKTINTFICCLFTISIFAQSFIEKNFANLLEKEEITRIQVTGKAFQMAATLTKNMKEKNAQDANRIVSKIKSFDMISMEDANNKQDLFKTGMNNSKGFDELIRVKNEKTNISIRIKESNNVISEIVGLIMDDKNFVVFNLVGEIDLDEISDLAGSINDETVSRVLKKDVFNNDLKVYPNPVKKGSTASIEVPENMIGGTLTIFNSEGKQISSYNINESTQNLNTSEFNSSTYVLKFENKGTSINKKLVVVE